MEVSKIILQPEKECLAVASLVHPIIVTQLYIENVINDLCGRAYTIEDIRDDLNEVVKNYKLYNFLDRYIHRYTSNLDYYSDLSIKVSGAEISGLLKNLKNVSHPTPTLYPISKIKKVKVEIAETEVSFFEIVRSGMNCALYLSPDANYFNYFICNDVLYEIVIDKEFILTTHHTTESLLKDLKGMGDGFLNKLKLITKESPGRLTFIKLDHNEKLFVGLNHNNKLVKVKPSRYLSRFPEVFSNTDAEDISAYVNNIDEINIKIVDGEEIAFYYKEENYVEDPGNNGSTLHKSCMRADKKSPMTYLYVKNPDIVKLVVGLKNGMVYCRALLWQTDQGVILMDRVYYIDEPSKQFLISQAIHNGWVYKQKQDAHSPTELMFNGEEFKDKVLSVTPNLKGIKHYPYMDTFKYLSISDKKLKNVNLGAFIQKLDDQYGQFPTGYKCNESALSPLVIAPLGEIEIGTHGLNLDGAIVEINENNILVNLQSKPLVLSKIDNPYLIDGVPWNSPKEDFINLTPYQSLAPFPDSIDYINGRGYKAYSSLVDKKTYISENNFLFNPKDISSISEMAQLFLTNYIVSIFSYTEIIKLMEVIQFRGLDYVEPGANLFLLEGYLYLKPPSHMMDYDADLTAQVTPNSFIKFIYHFKDLFTQYSLDYINLTKLKLLIKESVGPISEVVEVESRSGENYLNPFDCVTESPQAQRISIGTHSATYYSINIPPITP